MGWLRDATGGYGGGLLVLAGVLVLEAILVQPAAAGLVPSLQPRPATRVAE